MSGYVHTYICILEAQCTSFVHWGGGPSAWPTPSRSLGPLGGCLLASLGLFPMLGVGLGWQVDIPQGVLSVAAEVGEVTTTANALIQLSLASG